MTDEELRREIERWKSDKERGVLKIKEMIENGEYK